MLRELRRSSSATFRYFLNQALNALLAILIVCKDAPVQRSRRNQGTTKRSRGQQSIRASYRRHPAFCGRTCSPVIGHYEVYVDRYHITNTYARYLEGVVGRALKLPVLQSLHSDLPSGTRVIVPKANTTVAGDVALDATASNEIQLKGVVFHLTPISGPATEIGSAMATLGGWVLRWDSTSVPNGVYSLQSVALMSTAKWLRAIRSKSLYGTDGRVPSIAGWVAVRNLCHGFTIG